MITPPSLSQSFRVPLPVRKQTNIKQPNPPASSEQDKVVEEGAIIASSSSSRPFQDLVANSLEYSAHAYLLGGAIGGAIGSLISSVIIRAKGLDPSQTPPINFLFGSLGYEAGQLIGFCFDMVTLPVVAPLHYLARRWFGESNASHKNNES